MNPELTYQPQSDYSSNSLTAKDGVLETIPLLSLDLKDSYIIQTLHKTIENSQTYWNNAQGFNLKNKRIKNTSMLEGDHLKGMSLYAHQTRFIDNELFVGVDAITAYTTAQTPRSEVYPANKTDEDKVLSADLEAYHQAHSDKFHLAQKFDSATYDALTKYVGIIKLRWDPSRGRDGEVVPEVINPEHIIFDKNTKLGENPRFICHVLKDTIEGLISKFPDKERDILNTFKIERKGALNVSAEVAYREVWFTYHDKDNKPQEAVCWYVQNLVLDKSKDPNWLYGSEGENFLDEPMKPFILINTQNDGSHLVDKTSAVQLAIPQQEVLNKLGRQIIDNLSAANGFKVMDAAFMTKDDAENLTGDPTQTIVGKVPIGKNIGDVILQLPPQIVSQQLIAQVQDTRQTIHNILGTPSQFRGDDEDQVKTATQATMIKDQASGRQDKIVRAIEYAADNYFNLLTQMFCVWYDDKHYATVNGGDGSFDRIEMHKSKVKSNMTVRVVSGTTLPFDKSRQESVANNAAELGFLSPYDYFRLMHMDNPQKLYDNLVKFKSQPEQLVMDNANSKADRDAIVDFTELMDGKKPDDRIDPTSEYIEQLRKLMISDNFLDARRPQQKAVIKFVQKAVESMALRQELENIQPPTEQLPLPQPIQATVPQAPAPDPTQGSMGMPPGAPMGANPQALGAAQAMTGGGGQPQQMPGQPVQPPPPAGPQVMPGVPTAAQSPIASIMQGQMPGATPPPPTL